MKLLGSLIFLVVLTTSTMADPEFKEKSKQLSGLHGMGYIPMLPYTMLGYKPPLYAPMMAPQPGVFKLEDKEMLPPYLTPYFDLAKSLGYGGIQMPYGGYGNPKLYE